MLAGAKVWDLGGQEASGLAMPVLQLSQLVPTSPDRSREAWLKTGLQEQQQQHKQRGAEA